jgi:hypothetical protein
MGVTGSLLAGLQNESSDVDFIVYGNSWFTARDIITQAKKDRTPGRVFKNMGMPGHMGDERVTVQNLQVLQVRETEKVILISGAVPGANGSYVVVRPAIKKPEGLQALHEEHRKHDEAEQAKKPAIKIR